MHHHLEDVPNSVNQYLTPDQQIVTNPNVHKIHLELTMHLSINEHKKKTDRISASILQLTFKKVPVVEFWWHTKRKYPQLFPPLIAINCAWLDVLHIYTST